MNVKYDIEKLKEIAEDIRTVMGVSLSVVDVDFHTICSAKNNEEFCQRICSLPEGRSRCECSDIEMLKKCMTSRAPVVHICHAGIHDTAIPIIKSDIIVGYIFLGRVRPTESPDGIAERLGWLGDSSEDIAARYEKLPYFTEKQHSAMINLIANIIFDSAIEIEYEGVFEKAVEYIDRNLSTPLTVSLLCKELYVSKNRLYSIFREQKGMTVNEYIWERRLKLAKELLRFSDKSLYDVAASVGIDNYTYFCRLFKKNTGISPTAYRRLGAGKDGKDQHKLSQSHFSLQNPIL